MTGKNRKVRMTRADLQAGILTDKNRHLHFSLCRAEELGGLRHVIIPIIQLSSRPNS